MTDGFQFHAALDILVQPGMYSHWLFVLLLPAAACAGVGFPEVKTILETRCLKCHGESMQLGKLDLRTRTAALKGGEHGPAILEGNAVGSRLFLLVSGAVKPLMPMDGKLSAAEVDLLRRWIDEGAVWDGVLTAVTVKREAPPEQRVIPPSARSYWAFQKPRKGKFNSIDEYVEAQWKAKGLKPAPEAGREMLLRRAYLDLTGIPPTPSERREFLADRSVGAWERLIDKLLASPAYGEHWGRHWLDVARYADSNGYEHDFDRPNAWRYRDYVIAAFNKDTPYNRFLEEQIAGDELEPTPEHLIATGFLRNYAKVGFRENDNPQFRYDYLDDMIATIGRGVLGLTVQCARCHDHKFDPIPQRDYYAMQASLAGYVEVDHPLVARAEADAYAAKLHAVEDREKPLRAAIDTIEAPHRKLLLEAKYRKWPEHIQEAIFTPESKRTPGQALLANQIIRTTSVTSAEIDAVLLAAELTQKRELQRQLKAIAKDRPEPIPVAMGITDGDYRYTPDGPGDEPAAGKGVKREVSGGSYLADGVKPYQVPPSWFLYHGDINSHGPVMGPGFVQVAATPETPTVAQPATNRTSGRRLALARWLGSAENPLAARVIVNRIWHHHFGKGIVPTLDNFGKAGEPPTDQALLDWLAVEFMERGWSVKNMQRMIMTSRVYRMASDFSDTENEKLDTANQYQWRFRAQRLEAESIRDSILAVSGALNRRMYGPAVFPKLPPEILKSMDKGIWRKQEEGPETWRRSIYVYRKRGLPFPLFEVFDLPDQNLTCGGRNVSTVPTQALTLMNNEFVLNQARLLAARIEERGGDRIATAYELVLAREPKAQERELAERFLALNTLADYAHVLLNLSEFLYIR